MSVIGIYNCKNASDLVYYGLHSLQHRGQEGAGMVVVDENGKLNRYKGLGLVNEVFTADNLKNLPGNIAIGHVKYANKEVKGLDNVQPFYFKHNTGNFALANNGQLVNVNELKRYLEYHGSIFQSDSDSEILAHLIKKDTTNQNRLEVII